MSVEQAEALGEVEAVEAISSLLEGDDPIEPEEVEEEQDAPQEESDDVAEEATDEAEEATPEEDPLEEITWNGETKKVPKSELKELAQKGFDYTVKTQQLAEARKAFEVQVQAAQQMHQMQQQQVDMIAEVKGLDAQLEQFKSVNWHDLAESDPVKYLQLNQTYRDLKDARNEKVAEFQNRATQMQQYQHQQYAQTLAENSKKMAEKVPELSKTESKQALREFLNKEGYTDQEVSNLTDYRSATIAWKAMQYDKLQASKPALTKKVAEVPKLVKPGTNKVAPNKAMQDNMAMLRKTGRGDYATKIIESML